MNAYGDNANPPFLNDGERRFHRNLRSVIKTNFGERFDVLTKVHVVHFCGENIKNDLKRLSGAGNLWDKALRSIIPFAIVRSADQKLILAITSQAKRDGDGLIDVLLEMRVPSVCQKSDPANEDAWFLDFVSRLKAGSGQQVDAVQFVSKVTAGEAYLRKLFLDIRRKREERWRLVHEQFPRIAPGVHESEPEFDIFPEAALTSFLSAADIRTTGYASFAERSSVDLLITTSGPTATPICAVEFDGPLHHTDERKIANDKKKNLIFERAEIPLIRIRTWEVPVEFRWSDRNKPFLERTDYVSPAQVDQFEVALEQIMTAVRDRLHTDLRTANLIQRWASLRAQVQLEILTEIEAEGLPEIVAGGHLDLLDILDERSDERIEERFGEQELDEKIDLVLRTQLMNDESQVCRLYDDYFRLGGDRPEISFEGKGKHSRAVWTVRCEEKSRKLSIPVVKVQIFARKDSNVFSKGALSVGSRIRPIEEGVAEEQMLVRGIQFLRDEGAREVITAAQLADYRKHVSRRWMPREIEILSHAEYGDLESLAIQLERSRYALYVKHCRCNHVKTDQGTIDRLQREVGKDAVDFFRNGKSVGFPRAAT